MRKILSPGLFIIIAALLAGGLPGLAVPAQADSRDALVEEIQALKALVHQLTDRLESAEQKLEQVEDVQKTVQYVEDDLEDLDSRVGANERHTAIDRVNFSVDLKTEFTSLHYEDARVLPDWSQSMLSLWAFDQLAVPFNQGLTAPGAAVTPLNDALGTGIPTAFDPVGNGVDLNGDGFADYTFNTTFAATDSPFFQDLFGKMDEMFSRGFLSGLYLPTGLDLSTMGGPAFPAGTFVSAQDAQTLMTAFGMELGQFLTVLGQLAPNAQGVIAPSGAGGGMPFFSDQFTGADLSAYQGLFQTIDPQAQDIDNDAIWTTRFRLDMNADPHPNVTFGGRLSAYKTWADSTGIKWYSGDMSSVAMDGNVHTKGSDSAIRLERGFVTYRNDWDDVHWHFSLGRRPAVGGSPWEISQYDVVGASPMAHAINWQFDGASLGFDLSQKVGLEGFNFKLCYGQGFESGPGSGNSYAMDYSGDVDDVNFLGYILRLYDDGTTKLVNMYARAFDITDGFAGLVAMPFAISAVDADNDDIYDTYFLDANRGGYVSRMEAFTNIGDMDLLTLLLQSKFREVDWFVDLAMNHSRPSGRSLNPMMQFIGTDTLLGSFGNQDSHTGWSVWAGIRTPIPWTKGFLGFEYNYGSQYWFGFNGAEDTVNASKLGTRGHVYELYYHQPIIDKILLLTLGAQYYDYEYSLSGNPLGQPKKIEELNGLDTLMPVPDKLYSYYVNLNYRW